MTDKIYKLIGADGEEFESSVPGTLGGHRRLKILGRLDCPNARRWLERGHYRKYRVFFADEETAKAAGYRPCAVCMKEKYRSWKRSQERPPGEPEEVDLF